MHAIARSGQAAIVAFQLEPDARPAECPSRHRVGYFRRQRPGGPLPTMGGQQGKGAAHGKPQDKAEGKMWDLKLGTAGEKSITRKQEATTPDNKQHGGYTVGDPALASRVPESPSLRWHARARARHPIPHSRRLEPGTGSQE
ncbi:hypothetical protein E4U43_007306 [Claviceps pusilla]|uniref:Uncharacterized protein n=1 Tax=Claviceps pusilla TaxID=123648 RepID=A0A9P7T1S0_9HYPO|nr:hypothetical protein E4U43_007306 [Claviceps pusilla]